MNNKLEGIDGDLLDTVTGGSPATLVSKRLAQIWGHEGSVALLGKQKFLSGNGWTSGSGKFTVNGLEAGTQERSWTGKIVDGAVQNIRTKLIRWTN